VSALQVQTDQEIMLISSNGTLVRTPVAQVSIVGRNTQGVRLIRLSEGERLAGVEGVGSLGSDDEPVVAGGESVTDEGASEAPSDDARPH
ncbi:MAG: DNA gyrase C-terminal beta-propeller domain-containing protein, partial [Steroidobacteraceae bacterium]